MPTLRLTPAAEPALVLSARTGDVAAFTELVRRNQGAVRRLLRHLCGNDSQADDLAQEVFLRAWSRIADVKDPAALPAWLRQIAIRTYLQRRRRSHPALDDLDEQDDSIATLHPADSGSRVDLQRALDALSPGERLCVTLHHGEGMSHTEVAETTRLPLGTVKSHITRGTTKLRARMGMP